MNRFDIDNNFLFLSDLKVTLEMEEVQCITQDFVGIIMKWGGKWGIYLEKTTPSSLLNSTHFKLSMAENAGNC
jgi:hypothetical protein